MTERPGNRAGVVFLLVYHRIAREEARWTRSVEAFRNDLERLYDMGFRPVALSAYLSGEMDLPPGASPVVFTFDDSSSSQFRILEDGTVDPACAVGVWADFAAEHPGFPPLATFFVLPRQPWGQAAWLDRKLETLKEWGCELGSHTMTHANLRGLSDEGMKKELAGAADFIEGLGFEINSLSLPYGVSPKNRELLAGFEYEGKTYSLRAALLVGAEPARAPGSENLDPYLLPRIQATELEYGLTWWLDRVEAGKVRPYVEP